MENSIEPVTPATPVLHAHALAVFAHELRAPLASMLLAAQAITESTALSLDCQEMCAVVERQGQFLVRLIDDTLEVCQGSQGKICLQRDWFDLNAVLVSAAESTRSAFTQHRHRLKVALPPGRMFVLADAMRVQQIVVNLLINAAKYTPPGGSIVFEARVDANGIVIKVSDNGMGISANCLPYIFDLFHQVDMQPRAPFSGLGIGLALVKTLAELHGGDVRAHSLGEGLGTEFTVHLPGAAVRAEPDTCPVAAERTRVHTASRPCEGFMGDA